MADVVTEVPVEDVETEVTTEVEPESKPLGPNGEKALQSEREARKAAERAVAERDARLKEYEDRDKSESEKLAERASAAEQRAQTVEAELIRERIARRHKIDDDDLDLLGTGTEEQIEARAQRIAAKNAAAAASTATAPPSGKPTEKLRPGATSAEKDISPPDAYPASWRTARSQQT
jgi:hypothetical protein